MQHVYMAAAAAAPSFTLTTVQTIALQLLATAFVIVMAAKVWKHWQKGDWGMLTTEIIASAVASYFILSPDAAVATLQGLIHLVIPAAA